ncbi:MAG: class 1 fructose-bisphosphatase [Candidatus Peregrinibacteria bacterium]|nr:class 1 fructose-bisphosphatase [Candidatus Peregrinibacteria bacterium]MDZ4244992.1 class 1 fructose-bisphosphatase [Candidatus Gracilibacteria bacterium]
MNLEQYLESAGCESGLISVVLDLAECGKGIMDAIRTTETGAKLHSENSSGETQMALDVVSNDILTKALEANGNVSVVGSEELEDLPAFRDSGYAVVYDPLDGSSLLDVNLAVGTIVGIYKGTEIIGHTGETQVASLILVYGPRLTMMLTVRQGTHEFRLENDEFVRTKSDIKLDSDEKMFSPGNLRAAAHNEGYRNLVNYWLDNEYKLRYSGGMVPDINQILLKGCGSFIYPGYDAQPNGKLRLLFECAPMALLVEQAGGKASDGTMRILDLTIDKIHQRTPILIGRTEDVDKALEYL